MSRALLAASLRALFMGGWAPLAASSARREPVCSYAGREYSGAAGDSDVINGTCATTFGGAFSVAFTLRADAWAKRTRVLDFTVGGDQDLLAGADGTSGLFWRVIKDSTACGVSSVDPVALGVENRWLGVVELDGNVSLYMNGVLQEQRACQAPIAVPRTMHVGTGQANDLMFQGSLTDLWMWNEAVDWSDAVLPVATTTLADAATTTVANVDAMTTAAATTTVADATTTVADAAATTTVADAATTTVADAAATTTVADAAATTTVADAAATTTVAAATTTVGDAAATTTVADAAATTTVADAAATTTVAAATTTLADAAATTAADVAATTAAANVPEATSTDVATTTRPDPTTTPPEPTTTVAVPAGASSAAAATTTTPNAATTAVAPAAEGASATSTSAESGAVATTAVANADPPAATSAAAGNPSAGDSLTTAAPATPEPIASTTFFNTRNAEVTAGATTAESDSGGAVTTAPAGATSSVATSPMQVPRTTTRVVGSDPLVAETTAAGTAQATHTTPASPALQAAAPATSPEGVHPTTAIPSTTATTTTTTRAATTPTTTSLSLGAPLNSTTPAANNPTTTSTTLRSTTTTTSTTRATVTATATLTSTSTENATVDLVGAVESINDAQVQAVVLSASNESQVTVETEVGELNVFSLPPAAEKKPLVLAAVGRSKVVLAPSLLLAMPAVRFASSLRLKKPPVSTKREELATPVLDISLYDAAGKPIRGKLLKPLLFRLPGNFSRPGAGQKVACAYLESTPQGLTWSKKGVRRATAREVQEIGEVDEGCWCVTEHLSIFGAILEALLGCTNMELFTPRASRALYRHEGWWESWPAMQFTILICILFFAMTVGGIRECRAFTLGHAGYSGGQVTLCRRFMQCGPQLIKHKYIAFVVFLRDVVRCFTTGKSKLKENTLKAAVQRSLTVRSSVSLGCVSAHCWSGGKWSEAKASIPNAVVAQKLKFHGFEAEDVIRTELEPATCWALFQRFVVTYLACHPFLDALRLGDNSMTIRKRVTIQTATMFGVLATNAMVLSFSGSMRDWAADVDCIIAPTSGLFIFVATFVSITLNAVPNAFLAHVGRQTQGRASWDVLFWSLTALYLLMALFLVIVALANLNDLDATKWAATFEWVMMLKVVVMPLANALKATVLLEYFLFENHRNHQEQEFRMSLGLSVKQEKEASEEVTETMQMMARRAISAEELVKFCALLGDKIMPDFDVETSTTEDVSAAVKLLSIRPELYDLKVRVSEARGQQQGPKQRTLICNVFHLGKPTSECQRPCLDRHMSDPKEASVESGAWGCDWAYDASIPGLELEDALGFTVSDSAGQILGVAFLSLEEMLRGRGFKGDLQLMSATALEGLKVDPNSCEPPPFFPMPAQAGVVPFSAPKNVFSSTRSGKAERSWMQTFSSKKSERNSMMNTFSPTFSARRSVTSAAAAVGSAAASAGSVLHRVSKRRSSRHRKMQEQEQEGLLSSYLSVEVEMPQGFIEKLALNEVRKLKNSDIVDECEVPTDAQQIQADLIRLAAEHHWSRLSDSESSWCADQDPEGGDAAKFESEDGAASAFCEPQIFQDGVLPPDRLVIHARQGRFCHLVSSLLADALGNCAGAYENVQSRLENRDFLGIMEILQNAGCASVRFWIDVFATDLLDGHAEKQRHWHQELMAAYPTVIRSIRKNCCVQMIQDLHNKRPLRVALPTQLLILDDKCLLMQQPHSLAEMMLAKLMHVNQRMIVHEQHLSSPLPGNTLKSLVDALGTDEFLRGKRWTEPFLQDRQAVYDVITSLVIAGIKDNSHYTEDTWQKTNLTDTVAVVASSMMARKSLQGGDHGHESTAGGMDMDDAGDGGD